MTDFTLLTREENLEYISQALMQVGVRTSIGFQMVAASKDQAVWHLLQPYPKPTLGPVLFRRLGRKGEIDASVLKVSDFEELVTHETDFVIRDMCRALQMQVMAKWYGLNQGKLFSRQMVDFLKHIASGMLIVEASLAAGMNYEQGKTLAEKIKKQLHMRTIDQCAAFVREIEDKGTVVPIVWDYTSKEQR